MSYVMRLLDPRMYDTAAAIEPGLEPLDRVARDWTVTVDNERNRVVVSNMRAGDVEALTKACDQLGFPWTYDHDPNSFCEELFCVLRNPWIALRDTGR